MPVTGDLMEALLMLVIVVVGLAAVFVLLAKRTAKHSVPFDDSGMTKEPWNDGKAAGRQQWPWPNHDSSSDNRKSDER